MNHPSLFGHFNLMSQVTEGVAGPVARFTVPWYLGMTPLEFCVRAGEEGRGSGAS